MYPKTKDYSDIELVSHIQIELEKIRNCGRMLLTADETALQLKVKTDKLKSLLNLKKGILQHVYFKAVLSRQKEVNQILIATAKTLDPVAVQNFRQKMEGLL